jgi:hypothetical protein
MDAVWLTVKPTYSRAEERGEVIDEDSGPDSTDQDS